jgi:pimeloyl-ACP methyl ester carboxylesterase
VSLDGYRFAVRQVTPAAVRAGPTLVLLHEALGSIGQFYDLPQRLAAATGRPVVVYDRLGHGASDAAEGPRGSGYLHHEATHWLPRVRAALGLADIAVIGHSDGGVIALIHASRHAVRAVVAIAAHVDVDAETVAGVTAGRQRWFDSDIGARLARYHGDKTETLYFAWTDTWTAPWFRDWTIAPDLAGITAPVLAIQGEADEFAHIDQLDKMAAGVAGPIETVRLPGLGHHPHLADKAGTVDRVARFLTPHIG